MHSFSLFTGHGKWRWRLSIKFSPEKKNLTLCYFPLYFFAFCFFLYLQYCSECVSSTLSCSITVRMNFFNFSWNSIKQNINGTKLLKFYDFKENSAIFKYPSLLSCHWRAAEIPFMPLWGAAKTMPCAVQSCKAVLEWCEKQFFEGKMQFIVFSDGWWMWYVITFKPLLPTHSPLFYPCYLQPLYCHILGCCIFCKAD